MSAFYRFPAMARLAEWTNYEQLVCIEDELCDAVDAYQMWKAQRDPEREKRAYGMELMDVVHAAETALRMEFGDDEVAELQRAVIEKNRKRGYYDEL